MIGKRVIPCLLLQDGGLYKTVRYSEPKYVGDPINIVRIFNDKEVDEIVVLDIGATTSGTQIDFQRLEDFTSECFIPLCYGGGIQEIDDVSRLFELGVEKVSLNNTAVQRPELIEQAAEIFGSQSIVVSIDVKDFRLRGRSVVTRGGTHRTGLDPVAHARAVEARGAGEILLTSVDREGTRQGYDLGLIRKVADAVDIPVVAHGGAGSLADLAAAFEAGASGTAAGSLFVLQGPHRAVLVSYPSQTEQEEALLRRR